MNALLKSRRDVPEKLRLAGGVVNSPVWTRIFTDVLNIPAEIIENDELGAKGAAMSAGIAAGVYKDCEDAADKCVSVSSIVAPDPDGVRIYGKKYEKYRAAVDALDSAWEKLSEEI